MCSRVGGVVRHGGCWTLSALTLGILMADRAPAGMGCKAKRMELAPCAVRSLGWVQSVGTVTVGGSLRPAHLTPQAGRTDDGPKALPLRPSVRPAKGVFSERSTTVEEEIRNPAR